MSKLKKALDRAKEARSESPPALMTESSAIKKDFKRGVNEMKKTRSELHVSYSKTKKLDIDPNNLKKNKIISHLRKDEMVEQISIIRTQLLNKLEEIKGNTLMVTSAHPGEGKTFTSINLGVSIAQELHRTVLIVDCDLRQPDKTHYDFASDFFGVEIHKGLSDYLLGQVELEDILLNPGIERLTILPAGKPLLNSAELLSSARMEQLVIELKNRYGRDRIVIFDSPSILKISDPLAFSRYVDGILLVVEAKKSTTEDLNRVLSLLKDRLILGTVLNKVK